MNFRGSFVAATALAAVTAGSVPAQADNTNCSDAEFVVPDGSPHETSEGFRSSGGGFSGFRWFRFRISPDRSYAIITEDLGRGEYEKLLVSDPVTGSCGGPTLAVVDTSSAEPQTVDGSGAVGSERRSFKSSQSTDVFFGVRAQLAGSEYRQPFRVRVEETTLYSPLFSTFSGFEAYYQFQNTTGQNVSVTLKLVSNGGGTVAEDTFTVMANDSGPTRFTSESDLGVADDTVGHAIITHDGAPGSIHVDGFMSSSLAPVALPLKVIPAR